jgi:3-oxoacyl-[acyl-carrier-protein] synthase-1
VQQRTGQSLLVDIAAKTITEAAGVLPVATIPLLCCLPEPVDTRKRSAREPDFLSALQIQMKSVLHPRSALLAAGATGVYHALLRAREILAAGQATHCLICAVDSLINPEVLRDLDESGRLKTESNPDGLIPGEAGACILVAPRNSHGGLQVRGIGIANDPVRLGDGNPTLGTGLGEAIRYALNDASLTMDDLDYRLTDVTGERFWFSDATYGLARVLRVRKRYFEMWNISDTIGYAGTAMGVCMIAYLLYIFEHGLSRYPGVLLHSGSPSGERAAAVVTGELKAKAYGK